MKDQKVGAAQTIGLNRCGRVRKGKEIFYYQASMRAFGMTPRVDRTLTQMRDNNNASPKTLDVYNILYSLYSSINNPCLPPFMPFP